MDKRGEYEDFPSKIFCLTLPKIFGGESFTVALISGTEKVWRRWEGYQDFPSKIFRLTVPKIFLGEFFTVAVISGTGKVWIRKGEGSIKIFHQKIFLSHSAENFRRGILYCCSNFGYRKSLDKKGGGGEYQDIPSKIFCLTVPKKFVGESFSVSLISGIEKFYASEGYVTIFDFLSNFFCLPVPKNLVGEPFCAVFH